MQTKKDKKKNAEVSITGTLPKDRIQKETERTLTRIQREIELPGFRKGKVPIQKVKEYVGETALWREAAESAMKAEVEAILKEHEVLPIMPVGASLGASEVNDDVPFEIIAIVAPTCDISDYKAVAEKALAKITSLNIAKEQENALTEMRAQARAMTQSKGEGSFTDEESKLLGFENSIAAEFFLKHEAEHAVENRELQKKRGAIAEALIEKASCEIPRLFIMEEAANLLEATKKDVASQGIPFNDYLKRVSKTEEQIRDELSSPAEKRVALDIIFGEIARKEEIKPDEKEEERLSHALISQGVTHEQAHNYIRATVLREKVWEILGAKAITHDHGPKSESEITEGKSHSAKTSTEEASAVS
jgi:FKBP-type peptidyl-prolyl cis-trans isomerase (trigger factor)